MHLRGMQEAAGHPPRPAYRGQEQPAASGPSFRRPGSLSPSPRMPLGTDRSQWSGWGGQAQADSQWGSARPSANASARSREISPNTAQASSRMPPLRPIPSLAGASFESNRLVGNLPPPDTDIFGQYQAAQTAVPSSL